MPFRRILRIVLSAALIALVWMKVVREWRVLPQAWLIGAIVVSALLILIAVFEFTGMREKWARQRDEVPKKPLGLD